MDLAERIADKIKVVGAEAIIDDRENISIGAKIKDAKILGTPYILVLGDKMDGNTLEIEDTKTGEKTKTTMDNILAILQ